MTAANSAKGRANSVWLKRTISSIGRTFANIRISYLPSASSAGAGHRDDRAFALQ